MKHQRRTFFVGFECVVLTNHRAQGLHVRQRGCPVSEDAKRLPHRFHGSLHIERGKPLRFVGEPKGGGFDNDVAGTSQIVLAFKAYRDGAKARDQLVTREKLEHLTLLGHAREATHSSKSHKIEPCSPAEASGRAIRSACRGRNKPPRRSDSLAGVRLTDEFCA